MKTAESTPDINTPYALTAGQIQQFRRDGYIKLKDVFSKDELEYYRHEITRLVKELNQNDAPMEERSTYDQAFLQIQNLWRHSEKVHEFAFSQRLGRIATELLGTNGVRMYHDQALYKEASGGYTPWHVDQVYWPLSNNQTVTAWIPLHAVPLENGPLSFARGSQKMKEYRDLVISDDSEKLIDRKMKLSDYEVDESPYALGEVSFHYGYTFHRAAPNTAPNPREVMTVIYIDAEMKLAAPRSEAQKEDIQKWMPGAEDGQTINTELNPIIYKP